MYEQKDYKENTQYKYFKSHTEVGKTNKDYFKDLVGSPIDDFFNSIIAGGLINATVLQQKNGELYNSVPYQALNAAMCAYLDAIGENTSDKFYYGFHNLTGGFKEKIPDCSSGGGCFIGSSLVLMADYTTKKIKDINVGDKVISVKTGLPQSILLVDVPPVSSNELYGINDYEPFATTNHPFISDENKLLVKDVNNAINVSKHNKDNVKEIEINDKIRSIDEPITINNINIKKYDEIQLYNIITEDHTFYVNNFAVHDNSFNYEEYKKESMRIGIMILLTKDIFNDFTFDELFDKYHQEVMSIDINLDNFEEYFNNVVELCQNQKTLDFLYYLWCNKFDKFN